MKSIFLLALVFTGFCACSKKQDKLQLVLLNAEVTCVENIPTDPFRINEVNYMDNASYDSLSRNVIKYKLVNHSAKKFFMVLNSSQLSVSENIINNGNRVHGRSQLKSTLSFDLYKGDSLANGSIALTTGGEYKNALDYYKSESYRSHITDSLDIDAAVKMKLFRNKSRSTLNIDVLRHSIVIYPGETKYFSSLINLPLRKNKTYWITDMYDKKPDSAALTFVSSAERLNDILTRDQRAELEENGYVIFDGVIRSNKVPVRMVKLK